MLALKTDYKDIALYLINQGADFSYLSSKDLRKAGLTDTFISAKRNLEKRGIRVRRVSLA